MNNIAIAIPSLNPDQKLVDYVHGLIDAGYDCILLIDDGSRSSCKPLFAQLAALPQCHLIPHYVNMGKGRALKDALNYYMAYFAGRYQGVVSADSDGQHTVEDVHKLAQAIAAHPDSLVLGARDFNSPNVPPKSLLGNKITRLLIRLLYGGAITDTQTGLRGFPNAVIPRVLTLFGERFEYETTMLIEALRTKLPIVEVSIQTIYHNDNRETHFRPLADSWAIYRLIFATFIRYTASSLASFVLDLGLFQLFTLLFGGLGLAVQVPLATACARVLSSLFNYTVNRRVVFASRGRGNTLLRYYALCIAQAACSAAGVYLLATVLPLPTVAAKVIVDTLLFLVSFQIQQRFIFARN